MTKPNQAKYVWCDTEGKGRNLYACFRRTLEIDEEPTEATMHLFVDNAYQLFVNGEFVAFGPARFDPRYPLYDTVDLKPFLRQGENVIAVLANSFQMKTYKAIANRAGFVAWGTVATSSGQTVLLETGPGHWRCTPSEAHQRYTPKMSFALNPIDLFDQAGEQEGWPAPGFDDSRWLPEVPIEEQDSWGPLAPRSIPPMSMDEVPLVEVRRVAPLLDLEDRVSFSVPVPRHYEDDKDDFSGFIAYTTYLYSPCDQATTVGVFWGENWINGEELARGIDSINFNQRVNQRWHLKEGWNHYFGKVGAYQDVVEYYLSLPRDRGLVVSADRDESSPVIFRHAPVLTKQQYERHVADRPLPMSEEAIAAVGGWQDVLRGQPAESPCREAGLDVHGDPAEKVDLESLGGHVFPIELYPNGFALMLDLGQTRLAFPHIQAEGVTGAKIDFTYGEHLHEDGYRLKHMHNYMGGDRVFCSRDEIDWLPSHPRGMRYLTIAFRDTQRDLRLKSLRLVSAQYPVKARGRFECSDAALNSIWEMGRRTQATNMEDAYVDCVGRERGMYLRDTIIQYHVNLATFGDQALMGRGMQLYGQSPDDTGKFRAVYPNTGDYTIADFALDGVTGYRNYYEWSGDLERVREDWPAILNNLAWFHDLADERDDLLLDSEWHKKRSINAHYGGFHGDLGSHGVDNTGIHCTFSCTYLAAIHSAITLAKALGAAGDLPDLERRAAVLQESIPATFWDETAQCFADNHKKTSHSPHASAYATIAGVVASGRMDAVRSHLRRTLQHIFLNGHSPDGGTTMSPNYAFYIFEALYRAGLHEVAENLMREGWGWALAQGFATCPEYFRLSGSHCHAWSASPTYYLSKNALGVHFPNAPDMSKVAIQVQSGVEWAEGAFPLPQGGEVAVKWHLENGTRVFDYVKAPDGVETISHAS